MGINTVVVFFNDVVDLLEKDPEAGKKLHDAILQHMTRESRNMVFVGNGCVAEVLSQEHADVAQVLAVGGNRGRKLGFALDEETNHRILSELARQHGYRLVRDRVRQKKIPNTAACPDCQKEMPK